MTTTTLPSRFRLTTHEICTALAASGVTPAPGSGLPDPAATTGTAVAPSGVVGGDALSSTVALALRAVATTERILRIAVHRPGATVAHATQMVRLPAPDETVVSWASTDDDYSFVVVPNVNLAVILLDQVLSITDLVAGPGTAHLELDAAGFAAILAASDACQEHRLSERLDRAVDPTPPLLTAARLEECWQHGLDADDTRWAVAAARFTSPIESSTLTGRLGEGLASLRSLGLVVPSSGGDVPSDPGTFLFTVLGQIVASASVVTFALVEGRRVPLAPITLIRTATTIWAAGWTGPWSQATVTLTDLTVEGALGMLHTLVEGLATPVPTRQSDAAPSTPPTPDGIVPGPGPGPGPDPDPEATVRREDLPASDSPTATAGIAPAGADTAPPAAVWTETHAVAGTDPAPAWDQADPNRTPTANLQPGTPLRLLAINVGWAHVDAANGWQGWLDASRLRATSTATAPGAVWTETHAVAGTDAAPVWDRADANRAPVADLQPGTPLRLLTIDVGWAQVDAANGWQGWLDARRLLQR